MEIVPFSEAIAGMTSYTYTAPPGDEYGWVTDTEYFDDIDDPVTVKRRLWTLVSEDTVTFHPRHELCDVCGGDGAVPSPAGIDVDCEKCGGDGDHPLAGQMEIHSHEGEQG